MSSTSPTGPGGRSPEELWSSVVSRAPSVVKTSAESGAAGFCAIVPTYYGFMAKNAQQVGNPIPRMSVTHALRAGYGVAPQLGFTVFVQTAVQRTTELVLGNLSNHRKDNTITPEMVVGSLVGGCVSAPLWAKFNAKARMQPDGKTVKPLSAKQTGAIVARETSFLLSLRISEPVSEAMECRFGKNKVVKYGSAFITGAAGSLCGHPFDTALTVWQEGMKPSLRHCMRGALIKSVATGGFYVCYTIAKECFKSLEN